MTDYEEISIIVEQIHGLLSRADKMSKNGLNLNKQNIGSVVEDGVYKDFIRIIEKTREINDSNGFGQHGAFVSMANSATVLASLCFAYLEKLLKGRSIEEY